MKRLVWIAALTMAFAINVPEALAHGGAYRMPGGGVPPGLREPYDPTPPPPPPPSDGPITDPPSDDPDERPVTPPPNNPVTPGTPTPNGPGTLGGPSTPKRGPSLDYTNWIFWYEHNSQSIENVKESIYALRGSQSGLGILGSGVSNRTGMTQDVRRRIKTDIIPTLLWTIDKGAKIHPDLLSAAYIALAKVSTEPQHIDLLLKALHHRNPIFVKEGAAFGCGLLRRGEKSDQFSGTDLDRVRSRLFDMFDDERFSARERGFALLGVGLLGDQPTDVGANATTERLFDLLKADYSHNDLPTSILQSISLQPAASVTLTQRRTLQEGMLKSRIGSRTIPDLVAAHCAQALGRIGSDGDLLSLSRAFSTASRRTKRVTKRSAAIALGALGSRLGAKERVEAAKALLSGLRKAKDVSAVNFARISLARLTIADYEAGGTDVLTETRTGDDLLRTASRGRFNERDFGALALGLIGRAVEEYAVDSEAFGEFRSKAIAVLRQSVKKRKLDPRSRAAYVTALGLARDTRSRERFVEMLSDRNEDAELRGYCANALGLIGVPSPDVLKAIRGALKERRTEELRVRSARALGMLRDDAAVPLLIEELQNATGMSMKGQIAIALANVGDGRAVQPLVDLVRNDKEQDLTRAQGCACLGMLGDMELTPSLQRLRDDLNYRALSDLLAEAVSFL